MCVTSKRDITDEVILRVRAAYTKKLREILSSNGDKLDKSKPDIKQIFELTLTEGERFYVFWEAWKSCAKIKNDQQYTRSIAAFVTDLERAHRDHKYSISRELYYLIEHSPDPVVRKRAKEMKSFLFS